jgi:hypothetical protein
MRVKSVLFILVIAVTITSFALHAVALAGEEEEEHEEWQEHPMCLTSYEDERSDPSGCRGEDHQRHPTSVEVSYTDENGDLVSYDLSFEELERRVKAYVERRDQDENAKKKE